MNEWIVEWIGREEVWVGDHEREEGGKGIP